MTQEPQTRPTGSYRVVFVRRGGTQKFWHTAKAPKTEWMLERGKNNAALFAIRYWPSKKGWRVLDMRDAQSFIVPMALHTKWTGHRFVEKIFPSEDAAVMYAITLSAS